ncbi:MAG TPA: DUF2680 domain-containing protein [Spirochaetia bacterium]|nr:DUF2680 domain-containing protein [Spirochaetia bacterium]
MKSGKWRTGVIVLAVVVLVGSIAGVALANTPPSQGSATSVYQDFVAKLATNLGLSQVTVTSALKTTDQQMLAEAVAQGKLTQAQADKIESSPNFGMSGFGWGGGFRGGKGHGGPDGNPNDMASVLGISASQLKTDLQSGQTLQQIVTAQNMTMQQFQQKMLALKEQEISQEVSSGKITQDQANKMIQRMEQHQSGTTPPTQSNTTQS